jgi:hypothetical protein
MRRVTLALTLVLSITFIFVAGMAQHLQAMGKEIGVPMVTKEELKSMIDRPDVVILDVRESESWKEAKTKIQGAVREAPEKGVEPWISKYPPDKTYVLY